jgi:hypothetical protein
MLTKNQRYFSLVDRGFSFVTDEQTNGFWSFVHWTHEVATLSESDTESPHWIKKSVPLRATKMLGGRGGITPTHSRPLH